MARLELHGVAKHFGAIEALQGVDLSARAGRGAGPDGRQRRRQVDAGQDHRRQLPAVARARSASTATPQHFHKPVDARAQGIEVVYQDLALCDNLTAAENVFLGRELKQPLGPLQIDRLPGDVRSAPPSCSPS